MICVIKKYISLFLVGVLLSTIIPSCFAITNIDSNVFKTFLDKQGRRHCKHVNGITNHEVLIGYDDKVADNWKISDTWEELVTNYIVNKPVDKSNKNKNLNKIFQNIKKLMRLYRMELKFGTFDVKNSDSKKRKEVIFEDINKEFNKIKNTNSDGEFLELYNKINSFCDVLIKRINRLCAKCSHEKSYITLTPLLQIKEVLQKDGSMYGRFYKNMTSFTQWAKNKKFFFFTKKIKKKNNVCK